MDHGRVLLQEFQGEVIVKDKRSIIICLDYSTRLNLDLACQGSRPYLPPAI